MCPHAITDSRRCREGEKKKPVVKIRILRLRRRCILSSFTVIVPRSDIGANKKLFFFRNYKCTKKRREVGIRLPDPFPGVLLFIVFDNLLIA